ncbi:30S ribosomal protein S8e [Candidatus Geothermarchaeota archaeon ex4572_27]|nr:MAG: 30S ribosomal protein S8e [Candidatus Geothermarchaeota archaeon ex4572_27]
MVQWHWDLHKRKKSGGKKGIWRKKRKYEMGSDPTETLLADEERRRVDRVRGGNLKVRLLRGGTANVYIPSENRVVKARIVKVVENPASRDYSRRGVITKGAVILTEVGKAVVSSRPGQDGVINARLIEG